MTSSSRWRVGFDATPLIGDRTGVGTYVEHLAAGLATTDAVTRLRPTVFTVRGARPEVPGGEAVHRVRLPRSVWARLPLRCVGVRGIDVFHATNFVLPPTGRARGVVTVHDLSFVTEPGTVTADSLEYRRLVPLALRRAAAVCTPSAAVAAELVAQYEVDPVRVVATPLGVDPSWSRILPGPVPADVPAGPYLLAVGTLEPRKNLALLIAAHGELWRSGVQVPLLLTGPPGWGPQLALDTAPAGSVRLLGYLPREQLQRVVAGAAALAFPSRYEGFGLPPLEALAASTPVVTSDLPVLREVLGEHARFVAATDAGAWTAALREALADPPGAAALAAGRAHAATFTWARTLERTLVAYGIATS